MFKEVENALKQESYAFHGHAWNGGLGPMVALTMYDGDGRSVDKSMTVEEAEQLIKMIQDIIGQAKSLPTYEEVETPLWDDTPF